MSRKPLVDNERIIAEAEALAAHFEQEPRTWVYMARMIERILTDVVAKYEAALDKVQHAGLDASIAEGDVLDEWKERAWKAEKRIAELEASEPKPKPALRTLPMDDAPFDVASYLESEASEPEPVPGFFNAENMDYLHKMVHEHKKRIADLEATPRYDTLADYYRPKDDLEMVSRRIDRLADRVAMLERAQREGQGTL